MRSSRYVVDSADPRAPAQELWDRLSDDERLSVVASLPSEIRRALPPEGDAHRLPKKRALEALDEYYRRKGRRVYLSSELPIYYPDEPVFAPDLIAVLDVDPHERQSWVVSQERRGLDFVLEIHVSGDAEKDLDRNVVRYARLAIPEYFVFVPRRQRLVGYALGPTGGYRPVVPQGGLWPSAVLGLELSVAEGRLRFFDNTALLPDARELIDRLSSMVDDAVGRAEKEARRAEEEARRAEEEARRAEEEARRAERLASRLRELGVDPDSLE